MWSRNTNSTAGSGDPIKLRNEGHDIGHVLGDMAADYFVELIICERIRKDTQIVDYIGVGPGIGINADRARRLVPATADVENFFDLLWLAHFLQRRAGIN